MSKRPPSKARPGRPIVFALGKREVNRYDLYERCVQDPPIEAAFLRAVHGKNPRVLGEDFCGPASVARHWCTLGDEYRAVAVDLDSEPLAHARARAEERDKLATEPIMDRLILREKDVLAVKDRVDVIASLNFALCELHKRAWLMSYLRNAVYRLETGGILVADLYGGTEQFAPGTYDKSVPGEGGTVKYRWEQRPADALSARVVNAIHFVLPGRGTEKSRTFEDAFVYDWRLWSIAELREAMREAGFASTEVYTSYGDAMDTDGNLYVRPVATDDQPLDPEELEANYVAYVVGRVSKRR